MKKRQAACENGCVIFRDAWFVPDSDKQPLNLNVKTPHHPQRLNGSVHPTDFDILVPVPLLSVAGRFFLAVSSCEPQNAKAEPRAEQVMTCLREALFHWGIGGKTTSGNGRFNKERWQDEEQKRQAEVEQKRIAAEKEAALASMSPEERVILEFLQDHPNKAEKREWFKLYEELRKESGRFNTPELRRAVAERVKAGMIADKVWRDRGKDGERKKFVEKILGVS